MGRGVVEVGKGEGGGGTEEGRIISLISIKPLIFIIRIILIISIMSQVRIDVGIADHVWQENEQPLQQLLIYWVISSNLNFVRVGWQTSARPVAASDIVG